LVIFPSSASNVFDEIGSRLKEAQSSEIMYSLHSDSISSKIVFVKEALTSTQFFQLPLSFSIKM
jgi:hypothetical protein